MNFQKVNLPVPGVRKKSFLFLSLLFALIIPTDAQARKGVYIKGIRYWSNPDYTRIVIDLSSRTSYTYRLLRKDPSIRKPRRLYIDFRNSRIARGVKKSVPINDGLLIKARMGQHTPSAARVVLDIESIEDYRVFPLNDPFRLVIDVTGKRKKTVRTPSAFPPTRRFVPDGTFRIVIDPGHGGKDPGAIGRRGTREKDITLRIAKRIAWNLSKRLKGAKVILTRKRDVYIPLEERTAIANSKNADLFVSIHVNSSPRRAASGVETYILNLTNDEESRRVAARENATTKKGLGDLEYILADLIKTAKTNDSIRLATKVQETVVRRLRKRYRRVNGYGVKGAPFYVLVGTRMPSILVEVSFISNPMEERRLRDSRYLVELAEGITEGIIRYVKGGKGI